MDPVRGFSGVHVWVRLNLEWEPEGFVEKVGAVLMVDDARVAADLRQFRRLLEENGFETGAWRGQVT